MDAPFVGLMLLAFLSDRWKGLMEITKMGEYKFFLKATGGGELYLDEKRLITATDCEEASEPVQLSAGQHRLLVLFFCKVPETKEIDLAYIGPDTGGDERATVPVAALQHSEENCCVVGKAWLHCRVLLSGVQRFQDT